MNKRSIVGTYYQINDTKENTIHQSIGSNISKVNTQIILKENTQILKGLPNTVKSDTGFFFFNRISSFSNARRGVILYLLVLRQATHINLPLPGSGRRADLT